MTAHQPIDEDILLGILKALDIQRSGDAAKDIELIRTQFRKIKSNEPGKYVQLLNQLKDDIGVLGDIVQKFRTEIQTLKGQSIEY